MSLSRAEVYDLSIFLLIVQYRSFRKAADNLGITASALSLNLSVSDTDSIQAVQSC
jgi:hypothetical protein